MSTAVNLKFLGTISAAQGSVKRLSQPLGGGVWLHFVLALHLEIRGRGVAVRVPCGRAGRDANPASFQCLAGAGWVLVMAELMQHWKSICITVLQCRLSCRSWRLVFWASYCSPQSYPLPFASLSVDQPGLERFRWWGRSVGTDHPLIQQQWPGLGLRCFGLSPWL